jgi:hypothetical protein
MNKRNINHGIEGLTRNIPDAIWWALGAVSGLIAGRVIGRDVFKISVFQHTAAAGVIALCLLVAFLGLRKRLPQFSGWCLWFGTFCLGFLTLR